MVARGEHRTRLRTVILERRDGRRSHLGKESGLQESRPRKAYRKRWARDA